MKDEGRDSKSAEASSPTGPEKADKADKADKAGGTGRTGHTDIADVVDAVHVTAVLFDLLTTDCGKKFGIATLNSPKSLNALSLEMVYLLSEKSREWEQDENVVGVILRGSGDKAFCAGGDIRKLYDSVLDAKASDIRRSENCVDGVADSVESADARVDNRITPFTYAEEFFQAEYRLDYYIRKYPKPIVCFGNGYVMGGGIGLMSGASHRIVTETSRLAMPEVSIGFYPDVGGSYFLPRMPHRIGLFLSLTAAQLNAVDSVYVGLATHMVPAGALSDALLREIAASVWGDSAEKNSEQLGSIISAVSIGHDGVGSDSHSSDWPSSELIPALKDLQELMCDNEVPADALTVDEIASRFAAYIEREDGSAWIKKGIRNFQKGSPTSAAVCLEIWRRAQAHPLSEEETFRQEFVLSLGFCAQHDFAEGVRALMVDKDRAPRWRPDQLLDVSLELVEDHFSRFAGMQLDLHW